MRKIIVTIVMSTMILFIFSAFSHAAFTKCEPMKLVVVGTSGFWAKNLSGSSCGAIANNSSQYFTYSEEDQDRQIAVLLLAVSLDKTVSVYALGDVQGSVIADVSIIP